jgi:hypothetical protein
MGVSSPVQDLWAAALASFAPATSPEVAAAGQLLVPGRLCRAALRDALVYWGAGVGREEVEAASYEQLRVGSRQPRARALPVGVHLSNSSSLDLCLLLPPDFVSMPTRRAEVACARACIGERSLASPCAAIPCPSCAPAPTPTPKSPRPCCPRPPLSPPPPQPLHAGLPARCAAVGFGASPLIHPAPVLARPPLPLRRGPRAAPRAPRPRRRRRRLAWRRARRAVARAAAPRDARRGGGGRRRRGRRRVNRS